MVTQVLPRRKRMWSLSIRSCAHGPVSAAAVAMCRSTVAGGRPRKGDCSAKLGGATDVMALRDRFRFNAGAPWVSFGMSTDLSASVCGGMPLESVAVVAPAAWIGAAVPLLCWPRKPEEFCAVCCVRLGGFAWGVSSAGSAGNHTATDVRRMSLRTNCMPWSAVHHTNRPTRCSPATTKPTLAWRARRCALTAGPQRCGRWS